MKYISLSEYRYTWFYQHKDMPVPDEDLDLIKPFSTVQANNLWRTHISEEYSFVDELTKSDWPAKANTWTAEDAWQAQWDSNNKELPELILSEVQWEDNTVVYFCYSADHVVETRWDIFKRHWKNFLFLDDGPILIGKKRKEAVQFNQNGIFKIGSRP